MRIKLFGIGLSFHNTKFPVITIDWWKGETWHEHYLVGSKANPYYKKDKKSNA